MEHLPMVNGTTSKFIFMVRLIWYSPYNICDGTIWWQYQASYQRTLPKTQHFTGTSPLRNLNQTILPRIDGRGFVTLLETSSSLTPILNLRSHRACQTHSIVEECGVRHQSARHFRVQLCLLIWGCGIIKLTAYVQWSFPTVRSITWDADMTTP